MTLRSVLRLHPHKTTRIQGSIRVDGIDVMALRGRALTDFRGRTASMVFQEPMLALDPVYTVGRQITEAILQHEAISAAEAHARALDLFERVRIPSPARRLAAYPHEMSGGMRQRAMIALALSSRPEILLADEPTTALDATVQVQILLLLRELQRELGLSVIFVTHDISVAVEVADRIAVMYAGRIVEIGTVRDVIRAPRHPYTIGLLSTRAHGGRLHRQAPACHSRQSARSRQSAPGLRLCAALRWCSIAAGPRHPMPSRSAAGISCAAGAPPTPRPGRRPCPNPPSSGSEPCAFASSIPTPPPA